ncbi:hypothetical protein J6590_011452 [Homalodisca vitripennis]|nr:hypothetical protein J6590_011452 [Homalodisca vitripennis]
MLCNQTSSRTNHAKNNDKAMVALSSSRGHIWLGNAQQRMDLMALSANQAIGSGKVAGLWRWLELN